MIQLALYKHKRRFDFGAMLIRWWTKSAYSHCELVIDGMGYSSSIMDGGVRRKAIDFHNGHWDLIPLPWARQDAIEEFYRATKSEPYGWADLVLRQVFNKSGNSSGWFCSEWCAAALWLFNPQTYSPESLGAYCRERLAQ